jgi:hypothetical protein
MARDAVRRVITYNLDHTTEILIHEVVLTDWAPLLRGSLTRLAEHHTRPADFLDELGASLRKEAARMRRRT